HGLVEQVGERRWGGIKERMLAASAAAYVVSPSALGPVAADPGRSNDRLSASYLIAVAARIVREVGDLWRRARKEDKRLATLSIATVRPVRSPVERATISQELAGAAATLAAKYHDETSAASRAHRLVIASYPAPPETNAH